MNQLVLTPARFGFAQVDGADAAVVERDYCFERFFPGVTPEIVARLDARSTHFTIRCQKSGALVGGFRLTDIGTSSSEAESLFPDFRFQLPSKELGGFWVSNTENEAARGWVIAGEMFRFLRGLSWTTYFKTSAMKGRSARRFGVIDMKCEAYNQAMDYTCHLFRV